MLGKALGIPENSVSTYTEAEIRAGYDNEWNPTVSVISCHVYSYTMVFITINIPSMFFLTFLL